MEDIVIFIGLKVLNSNIFYMFYCSGNMQATFVENPQLINISYLIKAIKGILVNLALPFLHGIGGSLEIMLILPFMRAWSFQIPQSRDIVIVFCITCRVRILAFFHPHVIFLLYHLF